VRLPRPRDLDHTELWLARSKFPDRPPGTVQVLPKRVGNLVPRQTEQQAQSRFSEELAVARRDGLDDTLDPPKVLANWEAFAPATLTGNGSVRQVNVG
jgi:hypothetical protein